MEEIGVSPTASWTRGAQKKRPQNTIMPTSTSEAKISLTTPSTTAPRLMAPPLMRGEATLRKPGTPSTSPTNARQPLCAAYDGIRQGTDGFLEHGQVPGADVWPEGETARDLEPDGWWCSVHTADTTRKQTGMRLRRQGGGSMPGGTPRKTVGTSGVRGSLAS